MRKRYSKPLLPIDIDSMDEEQLILFVDYKISTIKGYDLNVSLDELLFNILEKDPDSDVEWLSMCINRMNQIRKNKVYNAQLNLI